MTGFLETCYAGLVNKQLFLDPTEKISNMHNSTETYRFENLAGKVAASKQTTRHHGKEEQERKEAAAAAKREKTPDNLTDISDDVNDDTSKT